jgi:hypothetical protein
VTEAYVLRNICNFNWNDFPVILKRQEMEAISHFRDLTKLFKNPRRPCEIANITQSERCQIVKRIDTLFDEAIKQYEDSLKMASKNDMKEIEKSLKKRAVTQVGTGVVGAVAGWGLSSGLLAFTPALIPAGATMLIMGTGALPRGEYSLR